MLTKDGHPRITTVHFEPLKRVVSEVVFHYKTNNTCEFSCNSEYTVVRVRLTQPITIIMHYYICVCRVIRD